MKMRTTTIRLFLFAIAYLVVAYVVRKPAEQALLIGLITAYILEPWVISKL